MTYESPVGANMFAYCGNNPVSMVDYGGEAAETIIDFASGLVSLYDMMRDPSWKNLGFLLWDAGSTLIPVVPGSYVKKGADYLDEFGPILSYGIKYTEKAIEQMNNFKDTHHSFPSLIDSMLDAGSVWLKKGGDNMFRIEIKLPGSINGKDGYFDYIIDFDGSCNHRHFNVYDAK